MLTVLAICFLTPLIAAKLSTHRSLTWLDPVITCYIVGLVIAHLPISLAPEALTAVTDSTIPLSIPLLLFNTDVRAWLRGSRQTIIGFSVGIVSVLIALPATTLMFQNLAELPILTGMLVGSWTGGTPNLMSVGRALQAPESLILLGNSADMFVGGIYLAILLSVGPMLRTIHGAPAEIVPLEAEGGVDDGESLRAKDGVLVVVLSIAITALAVGASMLLLGELSPPAVILGITTGGIAASFIERIRRMRVSYALGNYLILAFCVAIGCMTNVATLLDAGSEVLAFASVALLGTLALHYTACRLFRVDADTAIITSVSTIMGPALVMPVARRLNNRNALVSGVTSGLVGYAVANYLGIAVASLL